MTRKQHSVAFRVRSFPGGQNRRRLSPAPTTPTCTPPPCRPTYSGPAVAVLVENPLISCLFRFTCEAPTKHTVHVVETWPKRLRASDCTMALPRRRNCLLAAGPRLTHLLRQALQQSILPRLNSEVAMPGLVCEPWRCCFVVSIRTYFGRRRCVASHPRT